MTNTSTLQQLDSSLAMNLLRYLISLNVIITNGFLIFLFLRHRSLRNTQCNLLIGANAAIELIIGIGLATRGTFEIYSTSISLTSFTHTLCVWIGSPLTGGFAANQITILGLALDRLTAVAWPFSYGKKNKPFIYISYLLVILIFIGAIFISLWGIDESTPSYQCSMGANAGPLFATIWSIYAQIITFFVFSTYISMLILFYRQNRRFLSSPKTKITQVTPSPRMVPIQEKELKPVILNNLNNNKNNNNNLTLKRGSQLKQETILNQQQKQQMRLTLLVALILLIYTICWAFPTAIWFLFNVLDSSNRNRINVVTYIQGFLTPFGAGINLYIYLWRHAEIRKCARSTFPTLKYILTEDTFTNNTQMS
ncbi:G_PROTEIN_RECEP_F1_2 domain-containing protein [Meloidogyne graminicola]|uniref:G_PROTEIN_RECEP_F1_2 domain-containing protein n=1 Tax=Meloidogyne graminicola TaxID=189291 RepID=A0A8S9Z803_9BILA|nr:G_PROTEIN_RECEP_F1_2 domain-containing protein [Meloidogyne graminicola]